MTITTSEMELQRRCERLVQAEVYVCLSGLVSTLTEANADRTDHEGLTTLCDQAFELSAPVPDYEEAARQAGWRVDGSTGNSTWFHAEWFATAKEAMADARSNPDNGLATTYMAAIGVCLNEGIEPYECEVYEHWAVSEYFGRQLEAQGERVDFDFAGMVVWARTTTGQAISMDSCIRDVIAAIDKRIEANTKA